MLDRNRFKEKQLGMKLGTAAHRLRRIVMWDLIIQLGIDICYRCKKPMNVNDYSLDHKEPWYMTNTNLFWDTNNILFSHLRCNVGARREKFVPHGWGMYRKGCRCTICRKANTDKRAKYRKKYNRR